VLSLSAGGAFDFLAAKREHMTLHAIPLIALTDADDEDAELRALALDAADVAQRPLRPAPLLQRVRNLIRLGENTALRRALERDPLTGIFNRHTFSKRTAKMLRRKAGEVYHLMVWDVEHFKVINDLFGLATGDRVLRVIARCIDEQLRGVGTYARLESDRFALCYPARLYEPAELLGFATARLTEMDAGLHVSLYAGVYCVDDVALSVEQMCDRAYMALLTVKGHYHERFAYYDRAMRDRLMLEQRITSEMNAALLAGQFCFYVQPIYSITTGEPFMAEALVRWNHPELGVVPPRDFIPLFERNGFITKLDAYQWENVCKYQSDLIAEGITPLPLSVNFSRLNLLNPDLCRDVLETAEKYGLSPALLKLEITESAYTDHPEQLLSAIQTLRAKGFAILMDDFGSGYSSLSMLKELPVDILKVDMRFLTGMENNARAANIMTSIVRMAKWLDIVVVAEGVETQAQIDFLRSVGCDGVQGYFYARPMPLEDFTTLQRNPARISRPYDGDRERLISDFDLQSLWDDNQQASLLFNGMIGAIGLFEKTGDQLETVRVNQGYFELMGTTPQSLLHREQNPLEKLEPKERQALLNACDRAAVTHAVEQAQLHCPHADGHIMWLDIKVRHLGNVNLGALYYFAIADITRQKELERNYLLYQYATAMLDAYDEVLELNYTDGLATSFLVGGPGCYRTVTLPLESTLAAIPVKRAHPEDRPRLAQALTRETLEAHRQSGSRVPLSIELRTRKGEDPYHWTRITIHLLDDTAGKLRALCCSRHIDEQKQTERMQAEYMALQAKQQEQERYRTILEQTQTALLAWAPACPYAEGNTLAAAYRLSAVSFAELVTARVPADVADAQDAATLRALLSSLDGMTSAVRLLRLTLTGGETRWCKLCLMVQRDEAGDIVAVLATINDVDHEHRIQLQLDTQRMQNERRLSMLSHLYWTLPCIILQLNMSDPPQPIFFNRACWEMFGFSTLEAFDAVARRDLFSLIAPEERAHFLAQLKRCREERTLEAVDVTIVRPDGAPGSLRGNAAVSHGSDGQPMLQLVLLDVTEQREQEMRLDNTRATLERTTDMLQHLLENLPVGVTLFEFGTLPRALYINSRAYSMFGLSDHKPARFMELMRLTGYRLSYGEGEQPIRVLDESDADMANVTRLTQADGTPFWLRAYYTIVPQAATPPLCYAVLVDVTRQVQMERAYNRQTELYRIMMEDSQQIFFDYDLEKEVMHYTLRMPAGNREDRVVENYLRHVRRSTVIHADHIPSFLSCLKRYCRTRTPGKHEFMADFYGTNDFRWYRAYFRTIEDESGTLYRMIGRVVDVQEDKLREAQLGQAKVFRRAVNSVSLFVFAFDLPDMEPHLLSSDEHKSPSFHPFLAYLDPHTNADLLHPDECRAVTDALLPQNLTALFRAGSRELTIPFRAMDRMNNWVWLQMNLHLSAGEGRNTVSGIGYVKVIEDQKKLERKACFDGLTQLLNRATVEEQVEQALAESSEPCCLLIFDVDDFKSINDQYGHRMGDELLRELATAVRAKLRQSDIVGRLGGDEFVALLRGATEDIARDKSTELLATIEALNGTLPEQRGVSVSIGFACSPADGTSFTELYTAADKAMYLAKRKGKNRCCSAQECSPE
jgi:diguanylate cyclase (GGDEF)-like protein